MKKLAILILVLVLTTTGYSQQSNFAKVLYDNSDQGIVGQSISPALESGFMIIGRENQIVRVDTMSEPLWAFNFKNLDPGYVSSPTLTDVCVSADSCYYITGYLEESSTNNNHGLVVKIDKNGSILWSRTIAFDQSTYPIAIAPAKDSGLVLTGRVWERTAENVTILSSFFSHLDKSGEIKISRKISSGNNNSSLMVKAYDSTYVLSISPTLYNADGSLLALDSNGNQLWARVYSYPQEYVGPVIDFIENQAGYLLFTATGYLVQTDQNGLVIWTKKINGLVNPTDPLDFWGNCGHITSIKGGKYLLTAGLINYGEMVVIDSLGNPTFNMSLNLLPSEGFEMYENNYFIFGSGPLVFSKQATRAAYNTGIIRCDTSVHDIRCAYPTSIKSSTESAAYATDKNFTIQNAGTYKSIEMTTTALEVFTNEDCVDAWGAVDESKINLNCKIYPNPGRGLFTFELSEAWKGDIEVYNSTGKLVYEAKIKEQCASINLEGKAAGIYFYSLLFENGMKSSGKLCIIE